MNQQPAGWFPEGWPKAMADVLEVTRSDVDLLDSRCERSGSYLAWGTCPPAHPSAPV